MATSDYAFYAGGRVLVRPEFFLMLSERAQKYLDDDNKYFSSDDIRYLLNAIDVKCYRDRSNYMKAVYDDLCKKLVNDFAGVEDECGEVSCDGDK